jgi:hypothetical protein
MFLDSGQHERDAALHHYHAVMFSFLITNEQIPQQMAE